MCFRPRDIRFCITPPEPLLFAVFAQFGREARLAQHVQMCQEKRWKPVVLSRKGRPPGRRGRRWALAPPFPVFDIRYEQKLTGSTPVSPGRLKGAEEVKYHNQRKGSLEYQQTSPNIGGSLRTDVIHLGRLDMAWERNHRERPAGRLGGGRGVICIHPTQYTMAGVYAALGGSNAVIAMGRYSSSTRWH